MTERASCFVWPQVEQVLEVTKAIYFSVGFITFPLLFRFTQEGCKRFLSSPAPREYLSQRLVASSLNGVLLLGIPAWQILKQYQIISPHTSGSGNPIRLCTSQPAFQFYRLDIRSFLHTPLNFYGCWPRPVVTLMRLFYGVSSD